MTSYWEKKHGWVFLLIFTSCWALTLCHTNRKKKMPCKLLSRLNEYHYTCEVTGEDTDRGWKDKKREWPARPNRNCQTCFWLTKVEGDFLLLHYQEVWASFKCYLTCGLHSLCLWLSKQSCQLACCWEYWKSVHFDRVLASHCLYFR